MQCKNCGWPYVPNNTEKCGNCGHDNKPPLVEKLLGWIIIIVIIIAIAKCNK